MQDITAIFGQSSITALIVVAVAYFLKVAIQKRLEGIVGRVEEIGKTSLEVKKALRGEERGELVNFRVAVEKWQDFLQMLVADFTMTPSSKMNVAVFFEKDRALFLDVKIAVVRACTYLRNKDLECQLMEAVIQIRHLYYPLINKVVPDLIDLQAEQMLIDAKLQRFQQSGMTDRASAPTEMDRQEQQSIQERMTALVAAFSRDLLSEYRGIAERLNTVKEAINAYIYRRIEQVEVDQD